MEDNKKYILSINEETFFCKDVNEAKKILKHKYMASGDADVLITASLYTRHSSLEIDINVLEFLKNNGS